MFSPRVVLKINIFRITLLFSFMIICFVGISQSKAPHPVFVPFVGDVYHMEMVEVGKAKKYKTLIRKYGNFVYDYPKLGTIKIPKLKIPETDIEEGQFPGVEEKTEFAMVLHSTMKITHKACYEFSLNSDDGAILWIEGEEIINNDGEHKMTLKKDSFVYSPGIYNVKVWYFQGLPNKLGLILDARIIGRPKVCPSKPTKLSRPIVMSGQVYFESSSYRLKSSAFGELQRIAKTISEHEPTSVIITGYTDNVGTEEANLLLSEQRAHAIESALKEIIGKKGIRFVVLGLGESKPIADNETMEGRTKNRRVEIIMK